TVLRWPCHADLHLPGSTRSIVRCVHIAGVTSPSPRRRTLAETSRRRQSASLEATADSGFAARRHHPQQRPQWWRRRHPQWISKGPMGQPNQFSLTVDGQFVRAGPATGGRAAPDGRPLLPFRQVQLGSAGPSGIRGASGRLGRPRGRRVDPVHDGMDEAVRLPSGMTDEVRQHLAATPSGQPASPPPTASPYFPSAPRGPSGHVHRRGSPSPTRRGRPAVVAAPGRCLRTGERRTPGTPSLPRSGRRPGLRGRASGAGRMPTARG
ncbi:hypothetical protein P3T29_006553, partial [Kitasatospora sp. MAP5-34]|nr:hypothetical protein [Kitasatospora sp. MAP5-34]